MPAAGATTNLQLPYLEAAQAQKHVTVNESLRLLDALVQGNVISRTVSAQPGSPADGDLYILPAGKTGAAWGAMTNHAIAYWRDGVWAQLLPREGWTFYVRDEDQHVVYSGAAWGPILSAAQTAGFRNRLHNSAFAINQRGATSVADDAYGFDRWYALTSTGNVTIGALTDPETGRPTGIRLTQPDATPKRIGLAQIVESADIRDLRSVAAAMAARIRCSSSQPIRMAILEWTGTADAVTSDVVNDWASTTYTPSNFFIAGVNVIAVGSTTPAAATWTDMGQITGSFGASMTNAIVMVWTSGALAQNGTLDINQVQLEPSALCGAFARRPFADELAICQRHFWRLGGRSLFDTITTGFAASTTVAFTGLKLAQTMRATPALSAGSTSGFLCNDGLAANATSAVGYHGTVATNADYAFVMFTTTGLTSGRGVVVYANNTLNGYLDFSADL